MEPSARARIEAAVHAHPGIGFSALRRCAGVAVGTLQYHLRRSARIEERRGAVLPSGYCDTCPLRDRCRDRCLLRLLHHPVREAVIAGIARGETQASIARTLGLRESTVSHHVRRLREAGLLPKGSARKRRVQ